MKPIKSIVNTINNLDYYKNLKIIEQTATENLEMGYKGTTEDLGFIYAPYIPLYGIGNDADLEVNHNHLKLERAATLKEGITQCPSLTFGLTTTQKESHQSAESVGLG
jgi:hypothetical protein